MRVSLRRSSPIIVLSMVVTIAFRFEGLCRADTIVTINDLTETVSCSGIVTSRMSCDVTGESVQVFIGRPTGYVFFASTFSGETVGYSEADGLTLSDTVHGSIAGPAGKETADINFISDPFVSITCASFPGGCTPETGNPQLIGTVVWLDPTNPNPLTNTVGDSVYFQSDAEVPEPSSLSLLVAGLLGGLVWCVGRKRPLGLNFKGTSRQ
jgi:PEP-CTERM motif-containing protein